MEILKAYPNAAREKDLTGRLPIHLAASVAARSTDGKRIVNELVRVYPESLWVTDDTGRTAMEQVQIVQMQNVNEEGQMKMKKPLLECCVDNVEKKSEKQQSQQQQQEDCCEKMRLQQVDYESVYYLLSQGIATIPHAVSAESDSQEEEEADDDASNYWRAAIDASSGNTYYYNKKTKETSWTMPNGYNGSLSVGSDKRGKKSAKELMKNRRSERFTIKNTTMRNIFSIKEVGGGKTDQDSVDRDDRTLAQIRSFEYNMAKILSRKNDKGNDKVVGSTSPEKEVEEENLPSLFILNADQDGALVRCDDVMCYDGITHGLSGSMDKEEEEAAAAATIAKHLSPCHEVAANISNSAMDKMEEKEKTAKRPSSYRDVFNSKNKRRKKEPLLMSLVSSIGGSMSFEGIVSSYSKEKESHTTTQCDCNMCEEAAHISKDMSDIKRALLAFDLARPTLLFDYLVTSEWDNAMNRIREAPSEVKAWATNRKEVNDELVLDALPLHAAIVLGAPSDLIVALLNAYPSGAGEIDANRSFPIHLAASCLASIGRGDRVVDHLLKAFRSGKQANDSKGRTPSDIISIMSTSREHEKDHASIEAKLATTSSHESYEPNITVTKTFEDDAAFAYLVEKAMTNLDMSLKYQHTFLRQASIQGIETIDDLVMADDEVMNTLFSEKELTFELRRLLSLFIEDGG